MVEALSFPDSISYAPFQREVLSYICCWKYLLIFECDYYICMYICRHFMYNS